MDARFKIIQKNRKKITDAREKIAENARKTIKDARELLSTKKPTTIVKKVVKKPKIPRSRSAHLSMDDDLLMDEDDIELEELSTFKTKPVASIRRTVHNDIYRAPSPPHLPHRMPKLPTFSIQNREVSPSLDPFDCYIVPNRRPVVPAPPRITDRYQTGRMMSAHMDAYINKDEPVRKSILRSSSRSDEHDDRIENDRYISTESKSRYASQESAGIFAKISSPPRITKSGRRIIVSNLDPSVTDSEVRELFGDIGEVVSAKFIKIGTAEVIFRHDGDDERAHDAYHNRILDGLPMKITLVGSANKPSSSSYYRM